VEQGRLNRTCAGLTTRDERPDRNTKWQRAESDMSTAGSIPVSKPHRGFAFRAGLRLVAALVPVYRSLFLPCLASASTMTFDLHCHPPKLSRKPGLPGHKPAEPDSADQVPPLLPLLLSLVWRIDPHFPDNIFALRAVPFLALLGWLDSCSSSHAHHRRDTALWICALVAANQWAIFTSSIVMSESLFGLCMLGSIWFLEKLREADSLGLPWPPQALPSSRI